ncbi:DUF6538 domain-containing protein [Shimia sagamensis]
MLTHKTPAHTVWKNGIFYFRRRVPSDLSHRYTSRLITATCPTFG